MARVLGLEEVDSALRSAVSSALRLTDEAIVLPSASRSDESGSFKNVVFKLRADEPDLNPGVFECQLFTGLSAVAVDAADAKRILSDRKGSAERLAAAIPSELADAELAFAEWRFETSSVVSKRSRLSCEAHPSLVCEDLYAAGLMAGGEEEEDAEGLFFRLMAVEAGQMEE